MVETKTLRLSLCLLVSSFAVCFYLYFMVFISEMRKTVRFLPQTQKYHSDKISGDVSLVTSVDNGIRLNSFKILFWTPWYKHTNSSIVFREMSRPCKDLQYIITFDKDEYASADVIMFQLVDFNAMSHFPSVRSPSVPWILCIQETPINYPWRQGKRFDSIFNYTWSLRDESEVHYVIRDMFEPRQVPDEDWKFGSEFSKEFMRRKTGMAAWVVTNFHITPSKRTDFAHKLQSHGVNVTVFNDRRHGDDSSIFGFPWRPCPRSDACFRDVGLEHKFYFAFENSLCANSMSEKPARGIVHGMVPVFYGIFNLSSNAPPHSYIDAMEFNSTKSLAEYLIYLDKHDEEYFKYFEWRQNYSLKTDDSFSWLLYCPVFKKIRKLTEGNHRNVYSNLERWVTKFYKSGDATYCDVCIRGDDIDVDNPRATRERLYRGNNCIQ